MSEYRKPDPPSGEYEVFHSDELAGKILPEGSMYHDDHVGRWGTSIYVGEKPAPESWYAIPRPWRGMGEHEVIEDGDEWARDGVGDWTKVPASVYGSLPVDKLYESLIFRTRRPIEDAKAQEVDQVEKEKDNAIVPGDVVRLKSGGPDMTVVTVDDDRVKCVWFHRESGSWSYHPSRAAFGSFVIEKVSV